MYDYFYGPQADQFNFIRIPAVLFSKEEFKCISPEAKVLYGILLKRMDLSAKNGWFDEQGRVYIICTLEEVMETMNCADNKATKLMNLRYVKVLHYDHDGEIRVGELVVHKDILDDVTAIFAELFEKKYPINSMYLIDNYFGGETASAARERSAERDKTTCFCGGAGTAEGFGKAIVLNPGGRRVGGCCSSGIPGARLYQKRKPLRKNAVMRRQDGSIAAVKQ